MKFYSIILCLIALLSPLTSLAIPPERIVSLAPHITEQLFSIGAHEQLVATVEHSNYPAAARRLPRIGNVFQLDWEQLLSLQPDLVIAWKGGTPRGVLARLERLGLPVVLVEVGKLESIASQLVRLGELTGREEAASQVAGIYLNKLDDLKRTYTGRRRVKVFYEVDHKPLYTINGQQIISDAIRLCGGENIFSELAVLAPQVSIESVIQRAPEVIIYAGSTVDAESVFTDWKRWPQLPAVENKRLQRLEPDLINQPTTRMLQGIKQLCMTLERARE